MKKHDTPMRGARITGYGTALPEKILTNADLEEMVDTSDEWIVERSGIRERRIGGSTSGLAIEAAQKAMDMAGVAPDEIDMLLLATTTPDDQVPGTAPTVQNELGLVAVGRWTSTPPVPASSTASSMPTGSSVPAADKVLLIGVRDHSAASSTTPIAVRASSSATVRAPSYSRATDGPGQLLGWDLNSIGSLRHILYAEIGSNP